MAFEIPVLPEGMRVHIEGNGAGRIKYFESAKGKTGQYRLLLDEGNEAEVVWYKVDPIPPKYASDWPDQWHVTAGAHSVAATKWQKYGEQTRQPGPPPDLMGAAQRHTGVVRAPSDPQMGDLVCLCRHPLQNTGRHDRAKVIGTNGTIEPFVLQDLKTGAFSYGNSKQITVVPKNAMCPYDDTPIQMPSREVTPADRERGELLGEDSQGNMYFWGFRIGDDVSVRGWGAGKIHLVHTDQPQNKKPIVVRTARGQLINVALQDLSKITYGSVFPPLVQKIDEIDRKLTELINKLTGDGK